MPSFHQNLKSVGTESSFLFRRDPEHFRRTTVCLNNLSWHLFQIFDLQITQLQIRRFLFLRCPILRRSELADDRRYSSLPTLRKPILRKSVFYHRFHL